MGRWSCWIATLLLCVCSVSAFGAATVTGTLTDSSGNLYGAGTNILFKPLSTPQALGTTSVTSQNKTALSITGGTFSIALEQGDYQVTIGSVVKDSFVIAVPGGTNSYNINAITKTSLTYTYTSIPEYVLKNTLTTKGDLYVYDGTNVVRIGAGSNTQVLTADSTVSSGVKWFTAAGSGTVTSVALSAPAEFTVSGSPITTSGTLTLTKANQSANLIYSGPSSGAAAAPAFRSLVVADIPSALDATKISAGTVSNSEFDTLDGVTSSIQTQLNGKQASDGDLTAVAALAANGLVTRTATDTMTVRTITGTANQVSVSNGDGVSGNPTLSLPQDIHTGATPQFSRVGLGAAADANHLLTLALGTITTDKHALEASATWNASGVSFTGLKLNITDTASASGSLLADLQAGGVSKFKVDKAGVVTLATALAPANGGTGLTAAGTANQALGMNAAGTALEYKTLTAGQNISVTHGVGTVTIAAAGNVVSATGAGTDYTLTAASARIDFGTTDAEVTLPTAGTYLLTAHVQLDGVPQAHEVRLKFYNNTDASDVGVERQHTSQPGEGFVSITMTDVITVPASKLIQIYGFNFSGGAGTVTSTRTKISSVRLY